MTVDVFPWGYCQVDVLDGNNEPDVCGGKLSDEGICIDCGCDWGDEQTNKNKVLLDDSS